ncbi:MAG: hypothetical protein KJ970_17420 [Candidatus Eisenbacteria bacterium]|uniref:Uncharacterized protein n=1 Tax=Eiseniibacteriota bacterium TaxID=2212470 RepID=A0A948RZZ8_UNCEI|nr:hypothetical protein [Candidatus Eisenbacteria bacterium]
MPSKWRGVEAKVDAWQRPFLGVEQNEDGQPRYGTGAWCATFIRTILPVRPGAGHQSGPMIMTIRFDIGRLIKIPHKLNVPDTVEVF